MKTVAVIGGGITGLTAMYYLQKAVKADGLDVRLVLVEQNEQLGGKIKTIHEDPFIIEGGADSIVSRKANVAPFLKEIGLSDEAVYNTTGKSYIHADGQLKPIPSEALFGIPLSIQSLAESELVSAEGKVEALKDLYTPNTSFTKDDSIGRFLEAFLGRELVEKQIAPVLSGVYSGNLYDLTIASTLPYLLDYKNEYGSILRGLHANKEKYLSKGDKKFLSFQTGLGRIIDRLEELLEDVEIIKGAKAQSLEKTEEGYELMLMGYPAVKADFVILSTPHQTAQQLLEDEALQEDFSQLKNSSLISIYLGFDISDEELPADGTGFIKAGSSSLLCNACTWTSRKWEHTSRQNRLLVRLFYKSTLESYDSLQKMSEEELTKTALMDIEKSLGIQAEPVVSEVTKWHENMPNYHIAHHQLVKALEEKLGASYPGVLLAGASYYGVGIPDCIANGEKTAKQIMEKLG
ncbi:protoporphyrinogen oxidase [Bacillus massiliglaciei]|uniref:protoporphyrinogen oxidase n=1 Tax=Bacillus massiliglaciei TaxID=1816693 RepID=UPI000B105910|nr:protoporphyrinogen oxidase [Bacillus massiliglaciei]